MLRDQYVKGERERLLARAFMIRVLVLMTLVPGAGAQDAVIVAAASTPQSLDGIVVHASAPLGTNSCRTMCSNSVERV